MIIELILAFLIGILIGTITGLIPGLHINLIITFLSLSLFEKIISSNPFPMALFVVSLSITHVVTDFIPSILLGAPEEDSYLSILPGHKMLLEGRAYEAITLCIYGAISSILFIPFLSLIYILILPHIFQSIKPLIPLILIIASIYLIFREDKIFPALIIFFMSGFLGYFTFNAPVNEPLLPLLSGLFGISSIILSIRKNNKIPNQIIEKPKIKKIKFLKTILAGTIVTPFMSFLPGIGSGHSATISSEITKQNKKQFLFLIGFISILTMCLSFVASYSINKTRTGSAVAIMNYLGKISNLEISAIITTTIITIIISSLISISLAKFFVKNISKINYNSLSIIILFLIILINFLVSGPLSLFILFTSTSLGIYAQLSNSKKINLMGSLILPSIIFYIFN